MPDEPVPAAARLRAANARLRAAVEAKDAEISGLRLELDAVHETPTAQLTATQPGPTG